MKKNERSFTVEASTVDGGTGGRYINRRPRRAAMKAARVLLSESGRGEIRLQLRETTRGSSDKLYAYEARTQAVDKTIRRGGKSIRITQEIRLSKVPLFHGDGAIRKKQKQSQKSRGTKRGGDGWYSDRVVCEYMYDEYHKKILYIDEQQQYFIKTLELSFDEQGDEHQTTISNEFLHNVNEPPPEDTYVKLNPEDSEYDDDDEYDDYDEEEDEYDDYYNDEDEEEYKDKFRIKHTRFSFSFNDDESSVTYDDRPI